MNFRTTLDFLLHDWLGVTELSSRERFADHSRDTFDAVLDTCERIAHDKFAPFNRLVDTQEPRTETQPDGNLRVVLPQATADAYRAYAESGMLSAAQTYALGGMQLPYVVEAAANAFFAKASVSIGFGLLTTGNANLLMAHGTAMQQAVFAANEFSGRWAGTMCLSEPQAGSSLGDVATRATPDAGQPLGASGADTTAALTPSNARPGAASGTADWAVDPLGPRYRLKGHKMWISAGDHDLTENIVHLVLAKIPDANGKLPAGVKGISLFIVPKFLVHAPSCDPATEGFAAAVTLGARNDVALAGLNHKCGWRGTSNTLLNFGEGRYPVTGQTDGLDGQGAGALGYLVGQPGKGLQCMFHMMNEARIGVGMAATMLGFAGYEAALDYAKTRTQGRALHNKDQGSPPVRLIEHTDVKRMLLAQKAYCEGALALELYCARLVDEQHTGNPQEADDARLLLEVLTPIAKSWPSEWCLEANSLAIQVHGGYGYTRDFPVEQYWRDNRLNMIHEGTHGIQAMDLLGRKVLQEQGRGLTLLAARMLATAAGAEQLADDFADDLAAASSDKSAVITGRIMLPDASPSPAAAARAAVLRGQAGALRDALKQVTDATQAAWATGNPAEALANAVPYLQAFGHTVLAWMWLDVALVTQRHDATLSIASNVGRISTTAYFYHYELPKIGAWLQVVASRDMTCAAMAEAEF